jgi:hypothetical protein
MGGMSAPRVPRTACAGRIAAEAAATAAASCAKRKRRGKGDVMAHATLSDAVEATATAFGILGGVGERADGRERVEEARRCTAC